MSSSPGAYSSKDGPTATPPARPEAAATSASGTLDSTGMALVIGCYTLWGVFPLYFHLLSAAGSVEIIGHRILWTLVTCLTLIALRRRWAQLVHVVRSPRQQRAHVRRRPGLLHQPAGDGGPGLAGAA